MSQEVAATLVPSHGGPVDLWFSRLDLFRDDEKGRKGVFPFSYVQNEAHMWRFHVWLTITEIPLIPDVVALIMFHSRPLRVFLIPGPATKV